MRSSNRYYKILRLNYTFRMADEVIRRYMVWTSNVKGCIYIGAIDGILNLILITLEALTMWTDLAPALGSELSKGGGDLGWGRSWVGILWTGPVFLNSTRVGSFVSELYHAQDMVFLQHL